jgi:hypothetical protein
MIRAILNSYMYRFYPMKYIRILSTVVIFQLLFACKDKPKYVVQDVQLEEVKQEEIMEPPPAPAKRLTCADTSSFELGFFRFCKKQSADPSALRLVLSIWKIDSACIGVSFARILPSATDTSHRIDPTIAKNSYQAIAVSGVNYRDLNDAQIMTKMSEQIKEIANKDSFHQLPMYGSKEIVLFTLDDRQIKLK